MKMNEVKALLQKYYDGLTSPQEESDLEMYFLTGAIDPSMEADKLHFQAVSSMRNEEIPVPDDLEASVLETLSRVQKDQARGNRRILYTAFSVAAGLLLLVSTFVFLNRQNDIRPVTDPVVAYAESREALELVSKYFNEGTSRISDLGKIREAVEPLGKLNSLDKAAKSLSHLGKLKNQN
jgi:hypothetical protein